MSGIRDATVDDLYRVREKAELVNGELVVMSPGGGTHGYAAGVIYASLLDHARRTKRGIALPDNVGFLVNLPKRRSFSPDAAFWTGAPLTKNFWKVHRSLRWKYEATKTMGQLQSAPSRLNAPTTSWQERWLSGTSISARCECMSTVRRIPQA